MAAAAIVTAGVLGVLVAGAHPPDDKPKRIWAGNSGLYVRATLGSYCWAQQQGPTCADAVYPLKVRGRLPVRPRARVVLVMPDHPRLVRVSLLRVRDGKVETIDWAKRARRRSTDNPHRWVFRLPRKLRGASHLDVFARYPSGDANFWAGLD